MKEMIKRVIEIEMMKKPSSGFTDKVMNEIFELKVSFIRKPLISSKGWFAIGLFVLAFTSIIFIINPPSSGKGEIAWFNKIETFLSNIQLPSLNPALNINLYVIAGAFAALMILTLFDVILFRKKYQ